MLLLAACDVVDDVFGKDGESGETGAESGGGNGGDTSGDTGGDSGGEGPGLDTADSLCDEALPTTSPAGPDCLTAVVTCGQVIRGTTEGGSTEFNGDTYPDFFCFPNLSNRSYAGSERVYALDLDPEAYATATLRAPCAETGFAAMAWPTEEQCPYDAGVSACEGSEDLGGATLTFGGYTGVNRWLLVVDTPGTVPAPFEIEISCAG